MAIITTAEVKTFLQISGSTYDTLIAALIPKIQDWVVNYCNNPFHVITKKMYATTIAFVDSDPDTITDSASGFVSAGFTDAIDVHVEGSIDNDGIYAVDTVAAGTLTLASGESLIAEDAGSGVVITRVRFPQGIKLPVARLIGFDMQKNNMISVKSQSLGDYSVNYAGGSGVKDAGYPQGLLMDFAPYRQLYKNTVTPQSYYEPGCLS